MAGIVTISGGNALTVQQGSFEVGNPVLVIPNLLAHWDFSDLSTLFQDTGRTTPVTTNGQNIQGVEDKSGNGNHLSQASASNAPIYTTGVKNGLSSADGAANRFLNNGNSFSLGSPHTIVAVGRTRTTAIPANFSSTFIGPESTGPSNTSLNVGPGVGPFLGGVLYSTNAATVTSVVDPTSATGIWHVWVMEFDGVTNTMYTELTVDVTFGAAGAATRTTGTRIGHDGNLGGPDSGDWSSFMSEVYMINGLLNSATRISLTSLLQTKWNI